MALNAAIALAPEGMTIEAYEALADIPPYNDDVRETDEPTKKFVSDLLIALADWTRRLKRT